jgi:hypothetical protein
MMKKMLLLLGGLILALVAASSVRAQDNPYLGTWKLNAAKSKAEGMPVPKSMTRTVTADGDKVKYSYEGVMADGTAVAYSFTVAYDGKDYPVTGNGMPGGADSISIKREGTHKATAVLKKSGKELGTSTSEVSKDGKVTTLKLKGTADGKPVTGVTVYDKQ